MQIFVAIFETVANLLRITFSRRFLKLSAAVVSLQSLEIICLGSVKRLRRNFKWNIDFVKDPVNTHHPVTCSGVMTLI